MTKTMKGAARTTSLSSTNGIRWHQGEELFGKTTWYGEVPIKYLRVMAGNPPERHDPNGKRGRNQELKSSLLASGGPIQSITACGRRGDPYYVVADGNCRVSFTRHLFGLEKKVLVRLMDMSADEVWNELSNRGRARVLATWHKPWVFLHHPEMFRRPDGTLDRDYLNFQAMMRVIGKEVFTEFVKYGLSYSAYTQALRVSRFVQMTEPAQVGTILLWIARHRLTGFVEQVIVRGERPITPEEVVSAILGDRPVVTAKSITRVSVTVERG